MSGGSYDYLSSKDFSELASMGHIIQAMADRLAGLGYASDAARETEELLLTLRQMQNRIETMHTRLAPVWHAVEWWDSHDWGEERVKDALTQYRTGAEEPQP